MIPTRTAPSMGRAWALLAGMCLALAAPAIATGQSLTVTFDATFLGSIDPAKLPVPEIPASPLAPKAPVASDTGAAAQAPVGSPPQTVQTAPPGQQPRSRQPLQPAPSERQAGVPQQTPSLSPQQPQPAPGAQSPAATAAPAAGGWTQTGYASWYGSRFQGRPTASGEIYDMNKMTAAHKTLPFGSRVLVTNMQNKKTVVVTINDRGPFVAGRIIDLSHAAAQAIGLTGAGVVEVNLDLLGPNDAPGAPTGPAAQATAAAPASAATSPSRMPTTPVAPAAAATAIPPSTAPPAAGAASYVIQVAAFRNADNAERLDQFLLSNGLQATLEPAGDITRVVLPSVSAVDLAGIRQRLAALGIGAPLIRTE